MLPNCVSFYHWQVQNTKDDIPPLLLSYNSQKKKKEKLNLNIKDILSKSKNRTHRIALFIFSLGEKVKKYWGGKRNYTRTHFP